MRRLLAGLVALLGIASLATVVGGGVLLYPYVRDDMRLDWIVRAVALDWRDFGFERAAQRLEIELTDQAIGTHVGRDACGFRREDDGTRIVRCRWGIVVNAPGGFDFPIDFESVAIVDPGGDLRP